MKATYLIAGLQVLERYVKDEFHVVAEHGCIWAGPDYAGDVDCDDANLLRLFGWVWDESVDRWLAAL